MTEGAPLSQTLNFIAKKMSWGLSWGIAGRVFPVLSLALCARLLGASEFGIMTSMVIFVATVVSFLASGLQVTTIHSLAQAQGTKAETSGAIADAMLLGLFFCVAVSAALLLFPDSVAQYVVGSSTLARFLPLSALWAAAAVFNQISIGIFVSIERNRELLFMYLTQGVVTLLIVPLAAWQWGIVGALAAQGVSAAFGVLAALVGLRDFVTNPFGRRRTRRSATLIRMWVNAVPSTLGSLGWAWGQLLCVGMITEVSGGLQQLGHFGVAQQMFAALAFIPQFSAVGLAGTLYKAHAAGEVHRFQPVVRTSMILMLAYGVAAAIVMAACIPLIPWLFGASYAGSRSIIVVMACALPFAAIQMLAGQITASRGRFWFLAASNVVGGLVSVIVVYSLPKVGTTLALAYLASFLLRDILLLPGCLRAPRRLVAA